jgi:mRNA-degrading endonuclease toxin of MazEF toxin-antitoxin module
LASIEANAGEVWTVDFGTAAKQRPVLVLAFPQPSDARALVVVVPLISQIRGLRGEVDIGKPKWLPKHSAVNVQEFAGIDQNALLRKLGRLNDHQLDSVKDAIKELLDL